MHGGHLKAPKAAVAVLDTQIAIASPILKAGWDREWGFSEGLGFLQVGWCLFRDVY